MIFDDNFSGSAIRLSVLGRVQRVLEEAHDAPRLEQSFLLAEIIRHVQVRGEVCGNVLRGEARDRVFFALLFSSKRKTKMAKRKKGMKKKKRGRGKVARASIMISCRTESRSRISSIVYIIGLSSSCKYSTIRREMTCKNRAD